MARNSVMPASYKIDKKNRWVHTVHWGVLSRADFVSIVDRGLKDPDFDPSFGEIADFTEVTQVEVSGDDIRELAQKNIFSPHSRRAIVVPNDVIFGLARMYEILRDLQGETGIRVFRTLDEALDWVAPKARVPDTSPPPA